MLEIEVKLMNEKQFFEVFRKLPQKGWKMKIRDKDGKKQNGGKGLLQLRLPQGKKFTISPLRAVLISTKGEKLPMNFPEEVCRQLGINNNLGIKVDLASGRINCLTEEEVLTFRQKMLGVFGLQK